MPLELELIRASEFIRLNATGNFDLTASKLALIKIAQGCQKRGIDRAMLDLRELQPLPKARLSRADLIALINAFPYLGFSRTHRLALLYSADPHGRARLFAFITSMHGWQVRGFRSFEEAMLWLWQGHSEEVPAVERKRSVPIHSRSIAVRTRVSL
ncbi:MAG: hypothetical protein C5B50_18970 [Verrucomicrobia bacterium]|nr:MAG: hypothetical protein C5B50_18970 [Verrucomicrobiota bacterium]